MRNLNLKNVYDWPLAPRAILFGIVFIASLYFFYMWDIVDLKLHLTETQEKEQELKQQLIKSIEKDAVIRSDLAQLPALKARLADWQKNVIDYSKLPELLNDILKIGANNHLYFSLFNPEEEVKDDIYRKVPIKIIAVGSYNQIGDFVSQVATLPALVMVGDLIISNEAKAAGANKPEATTSQNQLTLTMTLFIFHMSPLESKKP